MRQNFVRGVASVRLQSNPITRVVPSSRRAAGEVSISSERIKEEKMEKEEEEQQQKDAAKDHHDGDMMADSFGEGYSTRSDEEGFGGIYGRNQVFGNPSRDAQPAGMHSRSPGFTSPICHLINTVFFYFAAAKKVLTSHRVVK